MKRLFSSFLLGIFFLTSVGFTRAEAADVAKSLSASDTLESAIVEFHKAAMSGKVLQAQAKIRHALIQANPSLQDLKEVLKNRLDQRQYEIAMSEIELMKDNQGEMAPEDIALVAQQLSLSFDKGLNFHHKTAEKMTNMGWVLITAGVIALIVTWIAHADKNSKENEQNLLQEDRVTAETDKTLIQNEVNRVQDLLNEGYSEEILDEWYDETDGQWYEEVRDLSLYKSELLDSLALTNEDLTILDMQIDNLDGKIEGARRTVKIAGLTGVSATVLGATLTTFGE